MSKTPNPVNLLISFQALRVSFQRRTLRLYTITIILFDPAIVTGNLRYAQFSFSFPSVAGVSAHSVQSTAGVSAHPVLSAARDSAPTINRFSPISNSQPVLVWIIDLVAPSILCTGLVLLPLVLPVSFVSSSRTSKGARDENLPIIPFIQPPSIPKAPTKTSIDGIPFNAFPTKFRRDQYTKVYRQSLSIPLVQAPSVSDLEITSDLLDRVSIDLWGDVRGQLGSMAQIKGALGSKKKVCHSRAKRKFGESDADSM
ncbi:hypothetical protein CK203_085858 [Vitis vinifera]|uniref:Uncharacterized protein n=1 Tax=Vitis vinifera TaxID=29760 RepID=A0A438DID8_VITVI|nr:hypothetical protein CK203_085858 [Vitis vinifera]